ncbi:hypothetical protein M5M_05240 [Simiduia agarivorans SA1 = DSM 21679]|uniref:Amidohydrolase-related domain-containing protein n=2 Tax=Simiduia TaxID=447467 RepID=K4KJS1_SIMAS|nr:hypothetical protein M5M_05240 [Simiduia agarivorans SA1 = DSM 21679]
MKRFQPHLLALLMSCIAIPAVADSHYVLAGQMIDTLKGKVIQAPLVEIDGDKIIKVTANGTAPADAKVIDLGAATLLPGLADLHTHLTYNVTDFGYPGLAISDTDQAISGVANARITLMAGFTSARNLGASGYADVSLRNAIDAGKVPGPRLQVSGPSIGATGGHCDNNLLPAKYDAVADGVADGPWEARKMVRRHAKYGADVIKICATGGVLSKGTSPGARQLTREEIEAIVDEAHNRGMKVAAHAHGTEGIRYAIDAGVDSIEHASLIDADGLKAAKKRGTFLSVNAYTPIFMLEKGASVGMLPESLEKARQLKIQRFETYRRAIKTGANIVFGSDSATYPHGDNARTFAVYVELGMTPMQAIQSATTVAARSLGWEGKTGAIAPGYYADMIAVAGNPLEDITELERVSFVMKGGEVFKR